MKAIILADRTHRSLKHWRPWQQIPLLRVGELSLVEHCVYSLASAGIKNIEVVLGPDAQATQQQLGCGARWGVKLSYFAGLGDEKPSELLPRMGPIVKPTLVVRGDVYRDDIVADFVKRAATSDRPELVATNDAGSLGLAYISSLQHVDSYLALGNSASAARENQMRFPGARLIKVESSDEFVAANARALQWGTLSGRLRGMNTRTGLLTDVDALVHRSATSNGLAYVGRQSRVCAKARLNDTVVLGDGVVVGRGSRLSNVIVFDGAVVPRNATLSNTIVAESGESRPLADLDASYRTLGSRKMDNRQRAKQLLTQT